MTIILHELKQNRLSLIIWTSGIGFLLAVCILIFPDIKMESSGISNLFSSMGGFTAAFGMDKVNFGTLTGFYAIECGNILGLGGALYASNSAISVLAKEEKDHTAEFLFTHPVRRIHIVTGKLISVLIQTVLLNAVLFLLAVSCILFIGEPVPWKELSLLHSAYFLLQAELAGICFGISAFLRRGSAGIGLGLAVMMYFLNLIVNLSDQWEFLKYITPFKYAEGTDIVTNLCLDLRLTLTGMALMTAGAACGYVKYCRKDIF